MNDLDFIILTLPVPNIGYIGLKRYANPCYVLYTVVGPALRLENHYLLSAWISCQYSVALRVIIARSGLWSDLWVGESEACVYGCRN